jgi:hypothetical protein
MTAERDSPPLDAAQLLQWQGLLGFYEAWLALFAAGEWQKVQADVQARADYCRSEIERAGGGQ